MCYYLELSAMGCHHKRHVLFPCSNPSICKPVPYLHLCYHPAECPLCLDGNLWPEAAYTSTEMACNVRSDVQDEITKFQAQQLLNFITYWLYDQYSLWDETGQGMVMSAAEAAHHEKFMLWVYYQETYCSHCLSRPPFGQHCRTCEASETTQNIVNLFRKQCVQQLALENFSNHEDAIEEIKASYVKPPHPNMENVNTWPFSRDRVAQRHSMAMSKVKSYMRQRQDGRRAPATGEEELYRLFGLEILTAASSLMACDTGLVDKNIIKILTYLAQILPYPDDRDQYTWSDKPALGLPAYHRVAMACIQQNGSAFITKMRRMNEALQEELESIRSRQRTAMNERKGELVVARLKHYSTVLTQRYQLEPDWICAICQDGVDTPAGGVIKLNTCGHIFHVDCMRDGVVQSTHGSTACPMCRKTFDGIDVNDDAHWWSMRMEQND